MVPRRRRPARPSRFPHGLPRSTASRILATSPGSHTDGTLACLRARPQSRDQRVRPVLDHLPRVPAAPVDEAVHPVRARGGLRSQPGGDVDREPDPRPAAPEGAARPPPSAAARGRSPPRSARHTAHRGPGRSGGRPVSSEDATRNQTHQAQPAPRLDDEPGDARQERQRAIRHGNWRSPSSGQAARTAQPGRDPRAAVPAHFPIRVRNR